YKLAYQLYEEKKYQEVVDATREILRGGTDDPVALPSANLAVSSMYGAFLASEEADRKKALETLEGVAGFIIKTWPGKAEADESRIMLAQARIAVGEHENALKMLDAVTAESRRYGNASLLAGKFYWSLYWQAKKSPMPDAAKMTEHRDTARKRLQ